MYELQIQTPYNEHHWTTIHSSEHREFLKPHKLRGYVNRIVRVLEVWEEQ